MELSFALLSPPSLAWTGSAAGPLRRSHPRRHAKTPAPTSSPPLKQAARAMPAIAPLLSPLLPPPPLLLLLLLLLLPPGAEALALRYTAALLFHSAILMSGEAVLKTPRGKPAAGQGRREGGRQATVSTLHGCHRKAASYAERRGTDSGPA